MDVQTQTETKEQKSESAELELLSFLVEDQEYSVDIMSVREIRGWSQTTSLPHAPAYVRGVINLRGAVLPVVDLGVRLGMSATDPSERSVIIVVDLGERTVGLRVDAVSDILAVAQDSLHPPPAKDGEASKGFIRALTIVNGNMIRILDLESLLPNHDLAAA